MIENVELRFVFGGSAEAVAELTTKVNEIIDHENYDNLEVVEEIVNDYIEGEK